MKLLALTEGADHVCYRYRVAPFDTALAERGWQLTCQPLQKSVIARYSQLRQASSADVVLLQRKLLPLWQLYALRRAAKAIVYDFDDAVFHRDSYHPKGVESWQRLARFWTTVYAADLVLAGNQFLFDQAAAFIGSERVRLVPTCVDPSLYRTAKHVAGESVRLVWIGQRSTVASLYQMQGQLEAATAACNVELRVVSDVFPSFERVRVTPIAWASASEAAHLTEADVGISWLPDDRWSRGKCGLKVLQYMAAGLPVVANRVGVHREMVIDGVTGYLADTPREWAAAIERLSGDAALRAKMGAAGRRRVEQDYSVARWRREFAATIDRLVVRPLEKQRDVQRESLETPMRLSA